MKTLNKKTTKYDSWTQTRQDVIERLDFVSEYKSLGLDIVGNVNGSQWVPCHDFGREDRTPSAAINVETGQYRDCKNDLTMSFFDFTIDKAGKFSSFVDSLQYYCEQTGVEFPKKKHCTQSVYPVAFNASLATPWFNKNQPITEKGFLLCGGLLAYSPKKTSDVRITMPVYGNTIDNAIGYVVWDRMGNDLEFPGANGTTIKRKMQTVVGSESGMIGLHGLKLIKKWQNTPDNIEDEPEAKPVKMTDAENWLCQFLSEGKKPVGEKYNPAPGTIRFEAEQAGHSWITIRRAKKSIGVVSKKNNFHGDWFWKLPLAFDILKASQGAQIDDQEDQEDNQNYMSTFENLNQVLKENDEPLPKVLKHKNEHLRQSFGLVVKCEGPKDAIALQSIIPDSQIDYFAVLANSGGANETPKPQELDYFRGQTVYVIPDCDRTGIKGGQKWAEAIASVASSTKIVQLPFEVKENHGKDLRDYFQDGKTFDDLLKLIETATEVEPKPEKNKPTQITPIGQIDPVSGKIVLDVNVTKPTAEAFIQKHYTRDGVQTLWFLNSVFYTWTNNSYQEVEEIVVKKYLLDFLTNAITQNEIGDTIVSKQFPAKEVNVVSVLQAVKTVCHLSQNQQFPCWIGNDPAPEYNPMMIIFGKTKNIDIETLTTFDTTPKWFNFNSIDVDYDETTLSCPRWDDFLLEVFDNDIEQITLLLAYIGLLLTPITKFQKALFIVGPTRCGKGTIAKVIRKLIGKNNCCAPTTETLTSQFGMQTLIGKTVATVSDARFHGPNNYILIERLLNIIGEDELTIERKHIKSIDQRLQTRFIFLSNEIPRLTDASTALANRFLMLKMTKSFLGKEDFDLEHKLYDELPGILRQSILAFKGLIAKGLFTQPEYAKSDLDDMKNLSSPVQQFVTECLTIDKESWIASDDLWDSWKKWCESEENYLGSKIQFVRNLKAYLHGINRIQRYDSNGVRFWAYSGIRINNNEF